MKDKQIAITLIEECLKGTDCFIRHSQVRQVAKKPHTFNVAIIQAYVKNGKKQIQIGPSENIVTKCLRKTFSIMKRNGGITDALIRVTVTI